MKRLKQLKSNFISKYLKTVVEAPIRDSRISQTQTACNVNDFTRF